VKDEVFEICGVLALCESLLASLGLSHEARRVAGVFDVVEGRLGQTQLCSSEGDASPGSLS
jgi:hypothetical protein